MFNCYCLAPHARAQSPGLGLVATGDMQSPTLDLGSLVPLPKSEELSLTPEHRHFPESTALACIHCQSSPIAGLLDMYGHKMKKNGPDLGARRFLLRPVPMAQPCWVTGKVNSLRKHTVYK